MDDTLGAFLGEKGVGEELRVVLVQLSDQMAEMVADPCFKGLAEELATDARWVRVRTLATQAIELMR